MNRARQTGVRLSRRFRSAQAFAVEPRAVEAARATLPGNEHRAGIFDPARARVSGCLAEVTQWIQSRRALGVMSDHNARAFGAAAARAFRRSVGTVGSGSSAAGAISSVKTPPGSTPA